MSIEENVKAIKEKMRQAANFPYPLGLSPCDLTGQTTTYGNILAQPSSKVKQKNLAHNAQTRYTRARAPHKKSGARGLSKSGFQHFFHRSRTARSSKVNFIYLPYCKILADSRAAPVFSALFVHDHQRLD